MKPQGHRKVRHTVAGHQDCSTCHPGPKPSHNKTARQAGKAEIRTGTEEESVVEIRREVEAMPPGHIGGAALALLEHYAKDPVAYAKDMAEAEAEWRLLLPHLFED